MPRLAFVQQITIVLNFSFAQSTSTQTPFVLTIEQNGKTLWAANIKGDSGGTKTQL